MRRARWSRRWWCGRELNGGVKGVVVVDPVVHEQVGGEGSTCSTPTSVPAWRRCPRPLGPGEECLPLGPGATSPWRGRLQLAGRRWATASATRLPTASTSWSASSGRGVRPGSRCRPGYSTPLTRPVEKRYLDPIAALMTSRVWPLGGHPLSFRVGTVCGGVDRDPGGGLREGSQPHRVDVGAVEAPVGDLRANSLSFPGLPARVALVHQGVARGRPASRWPPAP